MKLGEFRCLTRCCVCEKVIRNKNHKKCYKCYHEEKDRINNNQSGAEEYFARNENQDNKNIRNLGHVDSVKQNGVIRLFHINPNGFRPDKNEKIQMLLQNQRRVGFDGIFLSSPD